MAGRSYSQLGELVKYRKKSLEQIVRYIEYLEQIQALVEYLKAVQNLQKSYCSVPFTQKEDYSWRIHVEEQMVERYGTPE